VFATASVLRHAVSLDDRPDAVETVPSLLLAVWGFRDNYGRVIVDGLFTLIDSIST
jgi:hypothetical protein